MCLELTMPEAFDAYDDTALMSSFKKNEPVEQDEPAEAAEAEEISVPTQPSIVDTTCTHDLHRDPFVLKEDGCINPTCSKKMEYRVPCLSCFGQVGYCCTDCMWSDYHDHNFECMQAQRKAIHGKRSIPILRQKQVASGGFRKLIQKVVREIDRKTLLESLLFIRLPIDPHGKITSDHAIKKIPRTECVQLMSKNLCLREVYRRWIRHVQAADDVAPYLYFFAYPPDFSFTFMVAIPFEAQEKFDEALEPTHNFIPCPCTMHSGDAVNPAKPNPNVK